MGLNNYNVKNFLSKDMLLNLIMFHIFTAKGKCNCNSEAKLLK